MHYLYLTNISLVKTKKNLDISTIFLTLIKRTNFELVILTKIFYSVYFFLIKICVFLRKD